MSQTEIQPVDTKPPAVHSFQVVPLNSEKSVMELDPNEEKVFHGDCTLICIEGGANLSNPLSNHLYIKGNCNNRSGNKNVYYLDVMVFRIKAGKNGLKFSLFRPRLY
jgi:hypothetical protein